MKENFLVYQLYQQLRGVNLSDALTAFSSLSEEQLNHEIADEYFGSFGVGNIYNLLDRPYERFICYEYLLNMLRETNLSKFNQMHKGTPYFFLAWTAFDIGDYEKGLFYSDAAIAEDKRIPGRDWKSTPIGNMLRLNIDNSVFRFDRRLINQIQSLINTFNKNYSVPIKQEQFVSSFVIPLAEDSRNRSIVTSLYSFILEFYDRKEMLLLRSVKGGTIEPFLMHLLKGTVIFESLIKEIAQKKSWVMDSGNENGKFIKTLGNLNYCSTFTSKYCKLDSNKTVNDLQDILNLIQLFDIHTAINTVYLLRNKVAHDLRWNDVFNDVTNYEKLFQQIINAIFIVIQKDFLIL